MARRSKFYAVEADYQIGRETEKAVQFRFEMPGLNSVQTFWAPKSALRVVDQGFAGKAFEGRMVLAVAGWLVGQEKLWKAVGAEVTDRELHQVRVDGDEIKEAA